MTKGTVEVSNEFLSRLLFGNDEVNILGVNVDASEASGYTVFEVNGNPDLIGRTNNVRLRVIYQTETRIVNRKIEIVS